MEIHVAIEALIKHNISVSQYLFCIALLNNESLLYREYASNIKDLSTTELEDLVGKGWIDVTDADKALAFSNLEVSSKFKKAFAIDSEDSFSEFWELYPKRTPNGRILKSNRRKMEEKYLKLIRSNPGLHDTILSSLRKEVVHRTRYDQVNFWPMMDTWLNNRRWEDYSEESNEQQDNGSSFTKIL